MAGSPDDGGDGREVTKALRGEEGGRVACETQPRKKDKKRKTRSANKAPPPPPAPSQEHRASSSGDDGLACASDDIVAKSMREILAIKAKSMSIDEIRKNICVYQRYVFSC